MGLLSGLASVFRPARRDRRGNGATPSTDPQPGLDTLPSDAFLDRAPVHLLDQDISARIEDGVILIERPGEAAVRVRPSDVSALSIHGRAKVTTPLIAELLRHGRPVVWRSPSGYWMGQALGVSMSGAAVRKAQYAAENGALAQRIAARLLNTKFALMADVMRRRAPEATASRRKEMTRLAALAARVRDPAQLRGFEGKCTALYWQGFPDLLKAEGHSFTGRSRRPAGDPVNAALSYVYAVLTGECACAVACAGLDPAVGVFHAQRAGRPALALDLVEPFRPGVADAAVLNLINRGSLSPADFEHDEAGGLMLRQSARANVLAALEARLASRTRTEAGATVSWRDAIWQTAADIARSLRTGHVDMNLPVDA